MDVSDCHAVACVVGYHHSPANLYPNLDSHTGRHRSPHSDRHSHAYGDRNPCPDCDQDAVSCAHANRVPHAGAAYARTTDARAAYAGTTDAAAPYTGPANPRAAHAKAPDSQAAHANARSSHPKTDCYLWRQPG